MKSFLGKFYRHLAIFIWSHWMQVLCIVYLPRYLYVFVHRIANLTKEKLLGLCSSVPAKLLQTFLHFVCGLPTYHLPTYVYNGTWMPLFVLHLCITVPNKLLQSRCMMVHRCLYAICMVTHLCAYLGIWKYVKTCVGTSFTYIHVCFFSSVSIFLFLSLCLSICIWMNETPTLSVLLI